MKYMMVISYDGSKFHGFQRQNNVRNVQGYLEECISSILNENTIIKGSGRTDAGVHAYYQVVHFETNKSVRKLKSKLNKLLKDVKIKKIKRVNDDFHARHSVKSKVYLYKIDLSNKRNSNYYLRINIKLNISKMKKAAKIFIGTHNFENFVAGFRENYTSTIKNIKFYKINNILYIKFSGYGFYRYMVRNLVGALLEVGKNKLTEEELFDILNNKDNKKRLPTSSPNGLYLYKINY